MLSLWMRHAGWFVAVAVSLVFLTPAAGAESLTGVVVEEVSPVSTLAKAGIQPGDVLPAWERPPNPPANPEEAEGKIESYFDWDWLIVEQAPRGTVRLTGERGGESIVFDVAPGLWEAAVRVRLPKEMLAEYARGTELIEAEDVQAGVDALRAVAANEDLNADWRLRCWLRLRIGDVLREHQEREKAHEAYRSALEAAQDPQARVAIWQAIGDAYQKASEFEAAREAYVSAQEIRERTWGESLTLSKGLTALGDSDRKQGRLDAAQGNFQRALKIQQKLAPNSLKVAGSLNSLGVVASSRGELAQATEYYQRALEIRQRLAPSSLIVATSLNNLGIVARVGDDLAQASEYYERALEIRQKLAPATLIVAATLNDLGIVASLRGDLAQATEYYERALEIRQKLVPSSVAVAAVLINLGNVAKSRGDLAQATEYWERALEMSQRLAPSSFDVAGSLNNLGVVAYDRGDLAQATEYYERALEILQKLAPSSLDVARSLNNLGVVAADRGELFQATEYHERALEIKQKLAPSSLNVSASLNNLGDLARSSGNLAQASQYYEKALEIKQKLAPGSSAEAETLHALATVRCRQNLPQSALPLFQQAIRSLEDQVDRVSGSRDVQARFRAQRADYYRDTLDLEVELGQSAEAFHTLERSRAAGFLKQLAERDLTFTDLPEELDIRRLDLAVRYDRIQHQIAQLHPREQAQEIEALLEQLQGLRREARDIEEEILKTSPRLAGLNYPKPLDLEGAKQALDPGTVMLSYSVGEKETHLFIVTRDEDLQVETVSIGKEALRKDIETVVKLQKKGTRPYKEPLHEAARRLYQTLIQPAEAAIASSERILIIPDGPLHLLPFALLVRDNPELAGDRDYQYLVEWKPLHSALSATVFAELKNQRRSTEADGLKLAAFGDPQYSTGSGEDLTADRSMDVYVRAAAERGFNFQPLPYTREEVTQIAALYPENAVTYLGADATEDRAKALGKEPRILHFATHGKYDHRFPLNSYLAFTIPEEFQKDRDNGLLQAWEIFESVRFDADLVVLSACESGIGDELDGEGLIGLTRAFQFAGARTVASTLWQVDDRATAELMTLFYRHFSAGLPKDEALRAAQLELIRGPVAVKNSQGERVERDLSLPYYWAAFQVIGDWQ